VSEHWFVLAILSTLLNGLRAYATKLAVDHGTLPAAGRLVPPAIMVMLSLPALWTQGSSIGSHVALISALLQGSLFYVAATCRWEALHRGIPAYVLYPVVQASTPLIVVISAFLFQEWATIRQPHVLIGIGAAIAATYAVSEWNKSGLMAKHGLALATVAAVASAGATLAAKFAFDASASGTVFSFILVSNLAGVVVASVHTFATLPPVVFSAREWLWGTVIGALNFAGLALFLEALKHGDLALVASVSALSFVVPVGLGALFNREHLNLRQEIAILFSLVSLFLLAQA
jgi:drug/metabolite transporter (DMT)-like permease